MSDWECNGCGKCCTLVLPLSKAEIDDIKHYIRKKDIKSNNKNNLLFSKQFHDVCPFLTDENRCSIYEHRPRICSSFTCQSSLLSNDPKFDFTDKKLYNLMMVFYPNEPCYNVPPIEPMQARYNNYVDKIKKSQKKK